MSPKRCLVLSQLLLTATNSRHTIAPIMAQRTFELRSVGWFSLAFCIVWSGACSSKQPAHRGERDEIDLNQNVTVTIKPRDVVFKDFEQNWRQFISTNPRLEEPVAGLVPRREAVPEPIISPGCIYSDSAKGYVPRVTISWNEAPGQVVSVERTQAAGQVQVPEMRFDLGLHHDPFTRNYYSSVLTTETSKRFSLPSNSALVNDPGAVRLTGPGLFPQLLEFHYQLLQDVATHRQFAKSTVVLQELSEGLSYQMRVSRATGKGWTADRQFLFTSPVCQTTL